MIIIIKQLNSTNKNHRRGKNYYVSINYCNQKKKKKKIYYSRRKGKTYFKNNISGILTKIYSEHEQSYKMEFSVKTANLLKSLTVSKQKLHPRRQSGF